MYKSYQKNPTSQQAKQTKNYLHCLEAKQLLFGMTNLQVVIVNFVLYKCSTMRRFFYSHKRVAEELKCSEDYVQRTLRYAKKAGLIKVARRFNNSNVYGIPQWLRSQNIIDSLASFLPALRGVFCFSALLSCTLVGGSILALEKRLPEVCGLYLKKDIFKLSYLILKKKVLLSTEARRSFSEGGCEFNADELERKSSAVQEKTKKLQGEALKPLCGDNRGNYQNYALAMDYKDFLLNRYDRLVVLLTAAGKMDMLETNLRNYLDRLTFSDRLLIENEVNKIKNKLQTESTL